MFYFTGSTNAQDTICKRDKYCFAAKIYSVDHKVVWFKYAEGEAGILQHLPFNRLIKIKYAGGEDIFFYTFLKQASLGFSFYTNGNSTHQVFQGRSEEIYSSLSSSGALFTFIYRGTVAGISLSTGYAYTVTKLRSVSTYSYPPYSSTTSDHTSMTPYNNIPLLFSPRFCMGKSNKIGRAHV